MTNGMKLKKTLGLEDFLSVWITREIVQSTKPIYYVIYDSKRKELPLPKNRFKQFPYVSMTYNGSDLNTGKLETPTFTPLLDIEKWGGSIQSGLFITVDLSYSKLLRSTNFKRMPESINEPVTTVFKEYGKYELNEFITFKDLQRADVIAPATMTHRKVRNKAMGTENKTAKFIDIFINEADNSITFAFQTVATQSTDKVFVYPKDHKYKRVSPLNHKILPNKEKKYELQIKVLDFFDWLSTHPEGTPITEKDIKEILNVSSVQVFNTSPSFQYQGYNYWISQLDGSAYPTDIAPKVWDKRFGGEFFLDKHLYGLIRQVPFFLNPMASMLTKKLKDRGLI